MIRRYVNDYSFDPQNTKDIEIKSREFNKAMYHAFHNAIESNVFKGKHCAIVFRGSWGNPISMAVNEFEHAEVIALSGVPDDIIEECFILVIRSNKLMQMSNSMPCDKCKQYMRDRGLKTCVYSSGHFQFKRYNI